MLNEKNVLAHEWIGRNVSVLSNHGKHEREGKIVDETKETFTVEEKGTEKKVVKREKTFELKEGSRKYRVSGKLLAFRPEERLKQYIKR